MFIGTNDIPLIKKQLNNMLTPDFLTDLAKSNKFIQRSTIALMPLILSI